jgi:hypothetical protein
MLRSLIVMLVLGGLSFYHTDLGSESVWRSLVLPLLDFFFLVALAVWLVLFFHRRGIDQNASRGDGGAGGWSGSD